MYRSGTPKFYKQALAEETDNGFAVLLDGRPLKSPAGSPLCVSSAGLAQQIAEEWSAQEDTINPSIMPMTSMCCTMLDRIVPRKLEITKQLLRYVETDLLCYRAQEPADLTRRQHEEWQPLIDWVAESYGARLVVTEGILPVRQPQAALESLSTVIDELNDSELTALSCVAPIAGSIVVGLALVSGRIKATEAISIVQLDEEYQNEMWGTVEEAQLQQKGIQKEIESAATFVQLANS
jgi:chaperone required for assembly of F1-ATPase